MRSIFTFHPDPATQPWPHLHHPDPLSLFRSLVEYADLADLLVLGGSSEEEKVVNLIKVCVG